MFYTFYVGARDTVYRPEPLSIDRLLNEETIPVERLKRSIRFRKVTKNISDYVHHDPKFRSDWATKSILNFLYGWQ